MIKYDIIGVVYIKILLYILLGLVGAFLLMILFLTVVALTVNPKKHYEKEHPFYRGVLNVFSGAALWLLGVRTTVEGAEKLPKSGNFLFISNHRSNYDPIIQWYVLREYKLTFVSKKANFRVPWFGRIIHRCGFLPIDRKSPRKSMETLSKAAELLSSTEKCVGIYPEGTRSKSVELLPFHKGVLKIAQKAERPIVIAVIEGTEKVFRNILHFRRSRIVIRILETVDTERVKAVKSSELGEYAHALMESSFTDK